MGWTPSGSKTGDQRRSVETARFDPWQNRPDRALLRQGGSDRWRAALVWLAVFAVLVAVYTYHDDLGAVGWRLVDWGRGLASE